MSRILPLPPDAVSQIHSSKHITTLEGVVLSLLENSLDAGATKVEISINFRRGACTVEDNGAGIPQCEFLEHGGLGKPHHTSKYGANNLHGRAGLFLSSLSALSFLIITSRRFVQNDQATIILHNGQAIARHVPSLPAHELLVSPGQGTRITVRDLFGNMPVRVKQRDLLCDADIGTDRKWQEIKRCIVSLLLAWPRSCAIRLKEEDSEKNTMNISGYHPNLSTDLTEKNLKHLQGKEFRFDIRDSLTLLFQARLTTQTSRQSWMPLSASTETCALEGVICLEPSPHKNNQFISIGIHPCSLAGGHNEFNDVVNKAFARSSFGNEDEMTRGNIEKDQRNREQEQYKDDKPTMQLQGRKGVDKWPMFILRLTFKDLEKARTSAENMNDGMVKQILDVLEATVTEWLSAHHFRTPKRQRRKIEGQAPGNVTATMRLLSRDNKLRPTGTTSRPTTTDHSSTLKRKRVTDLSGLPSTRTPVDKSIQGHAFDTWSRIKSGVAAMNPNVQHDKRPITEPAPQLELDQPKSHTFQLPSIDIGELGSHKIRPKNTESNDMPVDPNKTSTNDDFGSFDDAAMLTLDEGEGKLCRNSSRNDQDYTPFSTEHACDEQLDGLQPIQWTDPITKQTLTIDARTDTALTARTREPSGSNGLKRNNGMSIREGASPNTRLSSAGLPLSISRRHLTTQNTAEAKWLPGFLKEWNNPVFSGQHDEPVRVLSFDEPGSEAHQTGNRSLDDRLSRYFGATGISGTKKLSKLRLQRAKVIKQVDGKFLLCKIPANVDLEADREGELLLLIDQHAASERVILEKLLRQICSPPRQSSPGASLMTNTRQNSVIETTVLNRPLRFEISELENDMFVSHAQHFARWGIMYDLAVALPPVTNSQPRAPAQGHKIVVRALPPGIAERCTLSPNLLIDLLRSEAWVAAETPRRTTQTSLGQIQDGNSTEQSHDHSWLTHIGSCPQGILDMLNSRACRSAIMFNDQLALEECETLFDDVRQCNFPFMCAHGRVSMVPLVELGASNDSVGLGDLMDSGLGRENSDDAGDSIKAYKDWMSRS